MDGGSKRASNPYTFQVTLDHGLLAAVSNRQLQATQLLLDALADPCCADSTGTCALAQAVASSDTPLVTLLLERGAAPSIQQPDAARRRIIDVAAARGNLEVFKALLIHEAEIDQK